MERKIIIEEKIKPEIGLLEWFRVGEYDAVEKAIEDIRRIGIKHLRTGISWADSYTPEGEKWYNWLIPTLAKELEILPCFLYTPPSLGIKQKTSSPPLNPKSYADFIDVMISRFGIYFEWIELWNEPNNLSEWDWTIDPDWNIFCEMVGGAAYWAKSRGKKTLLGGMSPVDPNWIELMYKRKVMDYIDAIGIHGFPDVFDAHWEGWETNINKIRQVVKKQKGDQKIWITEAGFSTWQYDEQRQVEEFIKLTELNVERFYWYSLKDLDPAIPTLDGFHLDEREYHFGMKKNNHSSKLIYQMLENHSITKIKEKTWISQKQNFNMDEQHILITGGAGFIGTNLAHHYLLLGKPVMILDNLSRSGVEENLQWLISKYGKDVRIQIADIRNEHAVQKAVLGAESVFHFAAQVAVTTSLVNPREDFEINARGTLNILNAITMLDSPPPLVFSSTNKVYGEMDDVDIEEKEKRFMSVKAEFKKFGLDESRSLSFHSPYGCSKGTADQYVIDFAKTFGIPATVFRMSCIYGPHQYGTEDQGWVAHFIINALNNKPLNIYGNGKQVRDILFIEDLIEAFVLAQKNIKNISGQAFNIGGGPDNAVSLIEVVEQISRFNKKEIDISYSNWREGDQKYYVSDTRKMELATGWTPKTNAKDGLQKLFNWLKEHQSKVTETITIKENI
jgi:CDP-paratose 2-epimerase